MKRQVFVSLDQKQMKDLWNSDHNKVRVFKGSSNQGKIMIDQNTWVEYDYSKDVATKVKTRNESKIQKDVFILPKYPILRTIRSELPDNTTESLKDMDLFIIKDIRECVLWNNNEFEFFK